MGYDPRIVFEPTIWIHGPGMVLGTLVLLVAAFFVTRRHPDWGLAAVVAATPLYEIRAHLAGLPTTFLELLFGAVILGVISRWPKEKPRRTPYDLWAALFVVGGLAAALVSPDLKQGLGLWRAFIFEPVVFFYAATAVFAKRDPKPLLVGAMGALAVVAAWTVCLLADGRGLTYDHRLLGPYQTANYLALFLVPLTLLTAFWPRKELLAPRAIVAATGLVMLLLSNSRGGLLALGAGLLVTVPFLGRRLRMILAAVLLGSLAAAAVFFGPRLVEHSEKQVISARPVIWREAAKMIGQQPVFGIGPGRFGDLFRARVAANQTESLYIAPQAHNAHDMWLVAWTEWGFLTFAALVGTVVTMVLTIRKRLSYWMVVPAAMLAATLLHGLVDVPVFKNDMAILFWLIAALTVVLPKARARRLS